jgi:demethylmenaquinone methyltransferase/2-methoxy-6-polyprenyl-1,4-benzoquinol methylase
VFHRVAKRYDIMNDLMSGGLHRLWKDAMVAWLNPPKRAGWRALDVAGGTGDIAFRIVEASERNAHVTVLDINGSMLEVGRERAEKRGLAGQCRFRRGQCRGTALRGRDVRRLYDRLRHPQRAAHRGGAGRGLSRAEAGGRFLCLEFSEVEMPLLDKVYEQWSFKAIPRIGKAVTGEASPMPIWWNRSANSPTSANFAAMIERAGFERVTFRNYSGGIAALHSGWKL